jgi:hypothetical protein
MSYIVILMSFIIIAIFVHAPTLYMNISLKWVEIMNYIICYSNEFHSHLPCPCSYNVMRNISLKCFLFALVYHTTKAILYYSLRLSH